MAGDAGRPSVSIVIPCYNYARYLAEAIESALAQTWPADEIVVVDDGSTDDSLEVAHRFDHELAIRIIAQANQGAISTFNNGIQASTGAFFVKLDADDRLHPRYLASTLPPLVAKPDAGFAYTGYRWFGARDVEFPAEPFKLNALALRPSIVSSALIRRAAFDAVGGYSQAMSSAYEDWDLFLSLAERGWAGTPVPELLFDYRIHPNGRNAITFRQWRRLMALLYRRHPCMRSAPLPLFLTRAIIDRGWRRLADALSASSKGGSSTSVQRDVEAAGGDQSEVASAPIAYQVSTDHDADCPLVSIITPSFNQAKYIGRTLESIRTQDYPNIEHVVIDGGSTDGTIEILKRQTFAVWISEPDRGQSHALNKGIARAKGDIIGWLNSDDMYTPGAVSRAVGTLQSEPQAPFVYGAWDIVDDTDRILEHRPARRSEVAKLINPSAGILPSQKIGQPTMFMRADAVRIAGGIDDRLHMCMDYDLMVRLSRLGAPALVSDTQALFRVTGESKTSFMPPAMWAESFAVIARYGDARRAHHVLLPLFYYAILRGQSITETRRALLAAVKRMEVPERDLLDPRLVLGYAQWSQAAQDMLRGDFRHALSYGAAAVRSRALKGPELAIVGRGILITATMLWDRIVGRRPAMEEFLGKIDHS